MMVHSTLGPSSSHRWLNCPPSVKLNENYADVSSEYALEGSEAHTLCEHRLKLALGIKTRDPTEDLSYYDEEMSECADLYTSYILEILSDMKKTSKDISILIEQQVSYEDYAKGGFGTADFLAVSDNVMHVVDYKYGKGIEVSAENNTQMMLYSLGALEMFDYIYEVDKVVMTIFQPRKNNISTFEMTKDEIYWWADTVLKPAANLALNGDGDFKSGNWCRFCKAKAKCRKRYEVNLEIAKHEFKDPSLLDDEEVADILSKLDEFLSWANDVKDYALKEALAGKKFTGFKLVAGRSTRKYINNDEVATVVEKAGFEPYEKKLLGITAMEKLLGKKKFNELLGGLIIKPEGKPTLVSVNDKRAELNNAKEDFK